jgi:hypothetical protein
MKAMLLRLEDRRKLGFGVKGQATPFAPNTQVYSN